MRTFAQKTRTFHTVTKGCYTMSLEIKNHHKVLARLLHNGGYIARVDIEDIPQLMELAENCSYFEITMFQDDDGNWASIRSYKD